MTAISPRQSIATVLALIDDPVRAARLRSAFGGQLHTLESQASLIVASRRPDVALVIVPAHDTGERSLATTVTTIRASRRGAPVYVYADRNAECLRALMGLARAGARGVIVRDVDDDVVSLRRLLERGTLSDAVDAVTHAVQEVMPARHLPLFILCLERIGDPLNATEFAQRLRVSRRTLSAWARKAGARGVRALSSKCRVLTAIALLRDSGRSVEQVAHALRFASSAHLHNTITRYTRLRPREAAMYDLAFWCRRLFIAGSTDPIGPLPPVKRNRPLAEWPIAPDHHTFDRVPEELTQ